MTNSTATTGKDSASPQPGWLKGAKIVLGIGLLVALILLGRQAAGYITDFAAWVDGLGFWGPVVFILGYIIATVAFIPGSLLTLAAGALFDLWGVIYVAVGATIGAALAFLISRYVARRAIERRLEGNERFQAIDRAVGTQGLKIVFLLRLSPIFPFNLLNYALGLTKVRFLDYVLASAGMLPGTFLYVYYGKTAGDLANLASGAEQAQGPEKWIFTVVGLIATIAVTTYVTRLARRALQQEVKDE